MMGVGLYELPLIEVGQILRRINSAIKWERGDYSRVDAWWDENADE